MAKEAAICAVEAMVDVIGGRWKAGILYNLLQRPHRFGELRRALGRVSDKVLMQALYQLERQGVVHRTVLKSVPPHVEYSLTEYGLTLAPILESLRAWGEEHLRRTANAE